MTANRIGNNCTRTVCTSVSRARPCEICGGDHKCSRGADGLFICGRTRGDVPGFVYLEQSKGDEQFALYRRDGDPHLNDDGRPHGQPYRQQQRVAADWEAKAREYAEALTPKRRRELASALGLPEAVLSHFRIGFLEKGPHRFEDKPHWRPCWTFPERDGAGKVIGLTCRYPDGQKKAAPGGKRGLFFSGAWKDGNGAIWFPEGPSDTLALTAIGLSAVGRPNNTAGIAHVADLLKSIPAERHIVILGEYDPKPNGTWPGRDGAAKTAAELTEKIRRTVHFAFPPAGFKDVRAWVNAQKSDPTIGDAWADLGAIFQAAMDGKYVQPSQDRQPGADAPIFFPDPIPASQLAIGGAAADWLWRGYLARRSVTLLTSLWKAGKSTLLANLVQAMGRGEELAGLPVAAGKVLIVSEESAALWAGRRDKLGIGDHALFYIRPFLGRPDLATWLAFVEHLAVQVRQRDLALVCLDTLATFSPCDDENDAAKMLAALSPLHKITEAGAAMLLNHHPRKGDGGEGQASRGSGALPGFVDVILEMRRVRANERSNRQRELTAYSRYDDTPAELVIELAEDGIGYRSLGAPAEADRHSRWQAIRDLLPGEAPGKTAEEVLAAWPEEGRKPGKRTLETDLTQGAEAGRWSMTGAGRRNDPFRFWSNGNSFRADIDPIAARNETESGQ